MSVREVYNELERLMVDTWLWEWAKAHRPQGCPVAEGTTRQRFIAILNRQEPNIQATILRGVLDRFPLGQGPETRTGELRSEIIAAIERLEAGASVATPQPRITSEVVERAIRDAETLVQRNGATSGVDRIHTALHGHLLAVCVEAGITYPPDPSLTVLFRQLRENHPALRDIGPRSQDIVQVVRTCGAILDALNPIRNRASVAHPNAELLEKPEAMLVINVARTLLHYFDAKLSGS